MGVGAPTSEVLKLEAWQKFRSTTRERLCALLPSVARVICESYTDATNCLHFIKCTDCDTNNAKYNF